MFVPVVYEKNLVEFQMIAAAGRPSKSTSPSDIDTFSRKIRVFCEKSLLNRFSEKPRFYRKRSRRSLVGRIPLSRG